MIPNLLYFAYNIVVLLFPKHLFFYLIYHSLVLLLLFLLSLLFLDFFLLLLFLHLYLRNVSLLLLHILTLDYANSSFPLSMNYL